VRLTCFAENESRPWPEFNSHSGVNTTPCGLGIIVDTGRGTCLAPFLGPIQLADNTIGNRLGHVDDGPVSVPFWRTPKVRTRCLTFTRGSAGTAYLGFQDGGAGKAAKSYDFDARSLGALLSLRQRRCGGFVGETPIGLAPKHTRWSIALRLVAAGRLARCIASVSFQAGRAARQILAAARAETRAPITEDLTWNEGRGRNWVHVASVSRHHRQINNG